MTHREWSNPRVPPMTSAGRVKAASRTVGGEMPRRARIEGFGAWTETAVARGITWALRASAPTRSKMPITGSGAFPDDGKWSVEDIPRLDESIGEHGIEFWSDFLDRLDRKVAHQTFIEPFGTTTFQ